MSLNVIPPIQNLIIHNAPWRTIPNSKFKTPNSDGVRRPINCNLPKRFLQPFQLLRRYLDDGAMTGREGSGGLCVCHPAEGAEVFATRKLVMTRHIAVVHQAPAATDEREHTGSLHIVLRLLAETVEQRP